MALKWTVLLGAHFRTELDEAQLKIYCDALKHHAPNDIETAMQRALHECEFLPKIADIEARLPHEQKDYYDPLNADFIPVKDWYEPYTATAKLHVWESAQGYKRVSVVKLKPGEWPPRIAADPVEEQISWEECWKRIGQIAKDKSMTKKRGAPSPAKPTT